MPCIEYIGHRDLPPHTTALILFEPGTRFEVTGQTRLVIGRGRTADVVVQSNRVARAHAAVFLLNPDRLTVVDLQTTNGTMIGEKTEPVGILSPGQEFWLAGLFGFRFLLDSAG